MHRWNSILFEIIYHRRKCDCVWCALRDHRIFVFHYYHGKSDLGKNVSGDRKYEYYHGMSADRLWIEYFTGSDDHFWHRTVPATWYCGSSAGNRSRTVCASGDLSDCVCEKNKESRIPSGIYASDKTGCDTVIRHWCACYFKYGADFRADHGIKCDFGGIFPDLCAGAWYLL